ncbi:MAG TPA: S8 family serine peptidase [Steroidobacteraceae bacterium]|nr:S8 family serine peptidase [Steroidobacteraceae bacterium]
MLLPLAAATTFGASCALAAAPNLCAHGGQWAPTAARAPVAVIEYLGALGDARFDLRAACAHWAGMFSQRHRSAANAAQRNRQVPARLIVFPAEGTSQRQLVDWLEHTGYVRDVELARNFVVVVFSRYTPTERLIAIINSPLVGYSEPDCDGPDYLTTSMELPPAAVSASRCWLRAARSTFPNDPCLDELWGHRKIGWDSGIAARSLPRIVAVLDSGIDAAHEDLARNVVLHLHAHETPGSQGGRLNARCATSGRCYAHGTEMAGTIGGRMDNGIGVAGVAPNSRLLPIVISRVDRGLLARISTIAAGIDAAVDDGAEIINISAKWPVDSRAISESIIAAVGGSSSARRLMVTGYATSLDRDDTVREYFPSQYRCLPGVIAAVPTDMRGDELFNPRGHPDANDGRIQAPGVDIVVTTTENSERGYALSESAGASSAAAYVSGAVALVWGSPPLNKCDAQQIKQLLFCRSKDSNSTRYPWVNVEFLRELANLDPGADCRSAMAALECN